MSHALTPPAEPARLSRLQIWEQQRRYFRGQGIRAWDEGQVPYTITNTPWIASAYARIVAAWIRDCLLLNQLDLSERLYVQEIGCGNGRFGCLFLRQLLECLDTWSSQTPAILHIYIDFSDHNLDVLRSHYSLQPLIAEGWWTLRSLMHSKVKKSLFRRMGPSSVLESQSTQQW